MEWGVLIGLAGLALAAITLYYNRKSAVHSKPEVRPPDIEAWAGFHRLAPDWIEVGITARNFQPERWHITEAKVVRPFRAKITDNARHEMTTPPNTWTQAETLSISFPSNLGRTINLDVDLPPGQPHKPTIRFLTLWVQIPPRSKRFSIRLTLRASAAMPRAAYIPLSASINMDEPNRSISIKPI